MVLAWLACATVGAVAVTTNTRSVGAEIAYFVDKAQCVAAITQPAVRRRWWPRPARTSSGSPSPRTTAIEPADGRRSWTIGIETVRVAVRRRRHVDRAARSSRCCRSGSCSPRARPASPRPWCTPTPTPSGPAATGPRNIDLGTDDRYLIYLPFFHVNAQSWSFFSVLGVGATAVLMPKWSTSRFWEVVARQRDHPHLADAVLHGHARGAGPPEDQAAGRGVRADHAGARPACSASGLRRLRHDRDRHPRHHRQAVRAAARRARWAT